MDAVDPAASSPVGLQPVPLTWYQRNKTQVKLLQFLIYHMRKEGIRIVPSAPPPPPPGLVIRKPGGLLRFD